ncbi:MAG: hypothetical protein KKD11_02100 [Candidatus Omnitrophica bacterium]|nr:hypothetical protein [Candidatus Omnitrophota bacterium]
MSKKAFEIALTVSIYKENGSYIAYTPALDLSTCGNTFEKAKKRFEEIVPLFIEELEKEGTLEEVLYSLGWRKVNKPRKRWIPPRFVGQIEEKFELPCPA